MRSYALAIAVTLLLSAFYVYQNPGDVTVSFFFFEKVFPQGIWEALLFAAGVVLMWAFSVLASLETWSKHRSQIKDRDRKIADLESERASLISAISRAGTNAGVQAEEQQQPFTMYAAAEEIDAPTNAEAQAKENDKA